MTRGDVWMLEVRVAPNQAERVAAALFSAGAGGLEERDGALVAYAESRRALAPLVAAVQQCGLEPELSRLSASEWQTPWTEYLEPVRVAEGFVLAPTGHDASPTEGARVLWFEPDLVFGVGSHATTRLAATAVERYVRAHPGTAVLDVGTGTGVLAMIAAACGARRCLGIDVDRRAVDNARANARLNGLACRFSARPLAAVKHRHDLVVANVEAPALFDLTPDLVRVTGDTLLVTGVLEERRSELAALLSDLSICGESTSDGWVLLEARRTRAGPTAKMD